MNKSTATLSLDFNPWTAVWTRPGSVIGALAKRTPTLHVFLLAGTFGAVNALNQASLRSLGDTLPLLVVLAVALLAGPIGGVVSMYLNAIVLEFTGRYIGGEASRREIRTAYAWSSVPWIVAFFLVAVEAALLGEELFQSWGPELDTSVPVLLGVFGLVVVELGLYLWSFVIFLKGLGEVQGFSAWKALGNVFLGGLLVLGVVAVLIGVIAVLFLLAI